jgi:two-component system LytT family sensor kinase
VAYTFNNAPRHFSNGDDLTVALERQIADAPRKYSRLSRHAVAGVLIAAMPLGLLESFKALVATRSRGITIPLPWLLVNNVPWWLLWAALTPLVVVAASKFPLDIVERRARHAAYHTLTVLVLSSAHLTVVGYLHFTLNRQRLPFATAGEVIRNWHINFTILNALTYALILGIYYTINYQRRYRETALVSARLAATAAQMESSVTAARLQALRMELNPHFLFNALNSVTGLIRKEEKERAISMIARLADLLRATLDRGAAPTMTLGEELRLLDMYVDIEKVRFGGRLHFEVDVPDLLRRAQVPTLALQPLVENAVRHGIATQKAGGVVLVRARRDNGSLMVDIQDTGPGVPPHVFESPNGGLGMANTRDRLHQLYGSSAGITLFNAPEGGAVCRFWLPYREKDNGTDV